MAGMRNDRLRGDTMPSQEIAPIIRDSLGRFEKGSIGQHASQNYEHMIWRNKMMASFKKCVSPKEFKAIVKKVVAEAIKGNKWAALEIMERTMGKEGLNVNISSENEIIWKIDFTDNNLQLVKPVENIIIEQNETNTI
jgi:hypothetical protein